MLLPRILTAALGIPLMLWLIFTGGHFFAAFVFLIIALSLYEYSGLMRLGAKPVNRPALYILGLIMPLMLYLAQFPLLYAKYLPGAALALTIISLICFEMLCKEKYIERIALTLLGILILPWCLFQFIPLRSLPCGRDITLLLIVTVWIMDTAAYFCGKRFGKRKLTELSPKKTWEGAAAGFISAIICPLIMQHFMAIPLSLRHTAALGILIGIFGQMSDIAESMIKRSVGAKDSSHLLPGHGGIMDRFDSYIFLAPAAYYFMVFIK